MSSNAVRKPRKSRGDDVQEPEREFRTIVKMMVVRQECEAGLTLEKYLLGEPDPEPGIDHTIWQGETVIAVWRASQYLAQNPKAPPDLTRFDNEGIAGRLFHPDYHRNELDPFKVVVEEYEQYHSGRHNETVDRVITDELENGISEGEDRAVWRNNKLLAVLRIGSDGEPEVIRLDGDGPAVTVKMPAAE